VGVQWVWWEMRSTEHAKDYTFFYVKGNENNQQVAGVFVHQ
jgi:hypothetical protein